MKTNIPTLTIGIPAYNEAENIGNLLKDIRSQHHTGFRLVEVLLVSDASTDSTVSMADKVKRLPLKIFINRHRRGLANSINLIFNKAKSDIVVTLDADIRLLGNTFLSKLLDPLINKEADYSTSSIVEAPPKSFFCGMLIT